MVPFFLSPSEQKDAARAKNQGRLAMGEKALSIPALCDFCEKITKQTTLASQVSHVGPCIRHVPQRRCM